MNNNTLLKKIIIYIICCLFVFVYSQPIIIDNNSYILEFQPIKFIESIYINEEIETLDNLIINKQIYYNAINKIKEIIIEDKKEPQNIEIYNIKKELPENIISSDKPSGLRIIEDKKESQNVEVYNKNKELPENIISSDKPSGLRIIDY